MKIKQVAEKIRNEMPEGLDELETLRYIYIYLGKQKRFDPMYCFADEKNKKKIYMLSKQKMHDEEYLTEKRELVCTTISALLRLVAKEFDIRLELSKDEDNHTYNVAILKNGIRILVDLQQDLKFIHTNQRTENFGQGNYGYYDISEYELEAIDEKIGYKKRNEDYKDEQIYQLARSARKKKKLVALSYIVENEEFNQTIQNSDGYMESISYIKRVFREANILDFVRIVTCSKSETSNLEEKQYTPLLFAKYKSEYAMYIFKKKEGKFVDISPERFKKLLNLGMRVNDDIYSKELMNFICFEDVAKER